MRDFFKKMLAEIIKQSKSDEPSLANLLEGSLLESFTPLLNYVFFPEFYLFLATNLMKKMLFSLIFAVPLFIGATVLENMLKKKQTNNDKLAFVFFIPFMVYGGKALLYGILLFKSL